MFGGVKKIPTLCPHCGFEQLEPAGLISTYCRGCGSHYSVGKTARTRQYHPRFSSIAVRPDPAAPGRRRRVRCTSCDQSHFAFTAAGQSHCPSCGTLVQLSDVEISGHSTRNIETCGAIHVGRDGFLNATRLRCGNAYVEGRISGRIRCENTLRLRGSDVSHARITTRQLIVDRHVHIRFLFPVFAENIVIRGSVEAAITCPGAIRIGRHGVLDGNVHARAMIVDNGGSYSGAVQVATTISYGEPEKNRDSPLDVQVAPAWRTANLAFG